MKWPHIFLYTRLVKKRGRVLFFLENVHRRFLYIKNCAKVDLIFLELLLTGNCIISYTSIQQCVVCGAFQSLIRKICKKGIWVLHELLFENWTQCSTVCSYIRNGNIRNANPTFFFHPIVTGGEKWVCMPTEKKNRTPTTEDSVEYEKCCPF